MQSVIVRALVRVADNDCDIVKTAHYNLRRGQCSGAAEQRVRLVLFFASRRLVPSLDCWLSAE